MSTTPESQDNFVRDMLRSHTLAQNTISRHNTDDAIFGSQELDLLREYCADPSRKDEILRKRDMLDNPGDEVGTRAHEKGSLAGYAIVAGALTGDQVEMLRAWFEKGGDVEGTA